VEREKDGLTCSGIEEMTADTEEMTTNGVEVRWRGKHGGESTVVEVARHGGEVSLETRGSRWAASRPTIGTVCGRRTPCT
jgi:hypothetical protein